MSRYDFRPRQSDSSFDVEPEYQPDPIDDDEFSQYLSLYLEDKNKKKLNKLKYPTNINDQTPAGADKVDIKTFVFDEDQKFEKKKKRNKKRAENQFDISAKPKDIKTFFSEVKDEIEFKKIESIDKNDESIEIDLVDLTPIQHEEFAIAELIVAKHNSVPDISEKYGLDLTYNNEIEVDYIEKLHVEIEPCDLNDRSIKIPIDWKNKDYNNELFVQRRLFGCLQHLVYSDPDFLKKHLPVKDPIVSVDNKKLFSDDKNSLNILKRNFKDNLKEFTSFANLIKNDKIQFNIVRKFLKFRHNHYLLCLLASSVLLFHKPDLLANRNLKVKDICPEFHSLRIKNVQISTMFNRIGIGFFSDYCNFSVIKVDIANIVHSRHFKRMKDLRKFSKNKKVKLVHDHSGQIDIINIIEQ